MLSCMTIGRRRSHLRMPSARRQIKSRVYSSTAMSTSCSSRFVTSPPMFLLHLSSITFGTFFIALVGARNNSSRASIARDRETETGIDTVQDTVDQQTTGLEMVMHEELAEEEEVDRIPPPQPSAKQLRSVSSVLRRQIGSASHGFDGLFTLRQLHMMRRPQLALPSISDAKSRMELKAEPWLWRLPAATAIHSIVRRGDARSIGAAVRLASNGMTWDYMMKTMVTGESGRPFVVGLDFTLRSPIISTSSSAPVNSPTRAIALPAPSFTPTSDPSNATSSDHVSSESSPSPSPNPTPSASSSPALVSPASPLPSTSSFRHQTLEFLFLFLARAPGRSHQTALVALSIALGCARLGIPVSAQMHWHTIKICFDLDRIDLAAQAWVDWLEHAQRTRTETQSIRSTFEKLRNRLRPRDNNSFDRHPSLKILAAVATLTRALDRQPSVENPLAAQLLHFLGSFPPRRRSRSEDGSELLPDVEGGTFASHITVYNFIAAVVNRKLEAVIGRPILTSLSTGYFVDSKALPHLPQFPTLPINTYNSLLLYALRRLHSVDIANHLLDILSSRKIHHTAATHNILLQYSTLHRLRPDEPADRIENIRSFPAYVTYLTRISNFVALDQIVFSLLQELEVSSTSNWASNRIPGGVAPPPARSKYIYTTLLNALQKAGRTGLAERVFRQARWAAALSRTREGEKAWVLPPIAFSMMLNLYAAEARKVYNLSNERSSQEEIDRSRGSRNGRGYVEGWGRHALRVFFIKQEQARLLDRFGPSFEVRTWRSERDLSIPPVLRNTAAHIVAVWELEGGSQALEMESLRLALRGRYSKRAVRELFMQSERDKEEFQALLSDGGMELPAVVDEEEEHI